MQLFGTPPHRAAGPPTRPCATSYMLRVLVQPLEHHPTEPQGHQPGRDNTGWGFWCNFWKNTPIFGTLPQLLEHHPIEPQGSGATTRTPTRSRATPRVQNRPISLHLHEGCNYDMTPRHYRKITHESAKMIEPDWTTEPSYRPQLGVHPTPRWAPNRCYSHPPFPQSLFKEIR